MRKILLLFLAILSLSVSAQSNGLIVYTTSNANVENLNVDIPSGAYEFTISLASGSGYGAFNMIDAQGVSLANDLCGVDENSRKTIPMNLFNSSSPYSKRVYFNSDCKRICVSNPNGQKFTLNFKYIKGDSKYDLVVAADGTGQLVDLYDAIKWVGDNPNSHKTIYVESGIYNMPELNFNTNVYRDYRNFSIIGEDKNDVIIQNTNGRYYPAKYDNSPLQFSGNCTIENVTVKSTDIDGSSKGMAYCIHADFKAHKDDVLTLKNCNFYNDHFAALALCPCPGHTIRLVDCTARTEGIKESKDSWQGVLISHDNNNGDGEGKGIIEILNSTLESDGNLMAITSNENPILLRVNDTDKFVYGEGKDFYTFFGKVTIDENFATDIYNLKKATSQIKITNNEIQISGYPKNKTIDVFNLAGEKMPIIISNMGKDAIINISNLPSGIYILKGLNFVHKFAKI